MAKIETLTTVGSGYLANSQITSNFQKVTTAMNNTLSRDGSSPNSMGADIDMNTYQLINLATPTLDQHAATKEYVDDATGAVELVDLAEAVQDAQDARDAAEIASEEAEDSAVEAAAQAEKLSGTSTSSITVGTGTKIFTTQASKLFDGQYVIVYSLANNANFMYGRADYSGTTLTVDVTVTGGSGAHADWIIFVSGARGAAGSAADLQADQVDYDNGTSGLSATDVQAAIDEIVAGTAAFSITGLTAITSLQTTDQLAVADASDSNNNKKITLANFETQVVTDVLSSQAQAEAGSNNTTLMSPLRVAQAITALTPASSGDYKLISTQTASNSSAITFTGLTGTYAKYVLEFYGVFPDSTSVMQVRLSTASTFRTADYRWVYTGINSGGTTISGSSTSDTAIKMHASTSATSGVSGTITISNPASTTVRKMVTFEYSSAFNYTSGNGTYDGSTAAVDGIRILMDTDNIATGVFKLYGIKA